MKEDFSREMEKEKSMNEKIEKKDQEIATMKEEFKKQVDRGEQKLAEQRKVCCTISIILLYSSCIT